jgi:hypothetical protein
MRSPAASWDRRESCEARITLGLLGQHRLFDEQGPQRRQFLQQHLGHRHRHPAVEVEAEVNRVAQCRAHLGNGRDHRIDGAVRVEHRHLLAAVESVGSLPTCVDHALAAV